MTLIALVNHEGQENSIQKMKKYQPFNIIKKIKNIFFKLSYINKTNFNLTYTDLIYKLIYIYIYIYIYINKIVLNIFTIISLLENH